MHRKHEHTCLCVKDYCNTWMLHENLMMRIQPQVGSWLVWPGWAVIFIFQTKDPTCLCIMQIICCRTWEIFFFIGIWCGLYGMQAMLENFEWHSRNRLIHCTRQNKMYLTETNKPRRKTHFKMFFYSTVLSVALPHPTTGHQHSWRSRSCPPHLLRPSPPSKRSRRKKWGQEIRCTVWWSAPETHHIIRNTKVRHGKAILLWTCHDIFCKGCSGKYTTVMSCNF